MEDPMGPFKRTDLQFGAISSGRVTSGGHFFALPRLANAMWKMHRPFETAQSSLRGELERVSMARCRIHEGSGLNQPGLLNRFGLQVPRGVLK